MNEGSAEIDPLDENSSFDLSRYFLKLGTIGFGGPIALISYMQRDLVERERIVSRDEFVEGLALAQLAPGPLAVQLAMYIGWLRRGFFGALASGVFFLLPSLLIVLLIAFFYTGSGSLPVQQGILSAIFYGVGASVITVIAVGTAKMARLVLKREKLLWFIFLLSLGLSLCTSIPSFWLFVIAGVVALIVRKALPPALTLFSIFPVIQFGNPLLPLLLKMFLYFFFAGSVVFGGGLVIVPYLHRGVVEQYQWITERQFLDAVAIAMITPGPMIVTVAFIGFIVAGFTGALISITGIFLPSLIIVVLAAHYYRRVRNNPGLMAFVEGITSAAIGAMASTIWTLGRSAIVDIPTAAIAAGSLALLLIFKNLSEPLVLLAAAIVGLACRYASV